MESTTTQPPTRAWYDLPPKDWEHLFYPTRDYQYFREPRPFADIADVQKPAEVCTPRTAAWMADAAVLAYGQSGPDPIPPLKFDDFLSKAGLKVHLIGDWGGTAKGTQGYFAYNSRFVFHDSASTE